MIIDCHGHYTTAPRQLEAWRKRQIAALEDKSQVPAKGSLGIGDDEIRESLESAQLQRLRPSENARISAQRLQATNGTLNVESIEDVGENGAGELGAKRSQNHPLALTLTRRDELRQFEVAGRVHIDAFDGAGLH